jgi:hypothetical protein
MLARRLSEPCRDGSVCGQVGLRPAAKFATNEAVVLRSTGSFYGFLFSVAWDLESFRQMESRFVEWQVMDGGP